MNKSILDTDIFNSTIELAGHCKMQGKWQDAINLLEGVDATTKDLSNHDQAKVQLEIGRTLTDEALFGGKENQAIRTNILYQALEYAKSHGDKALLGDVYDAIGFSLHTSYLESNKSQEPEKEMDFFKRGLDLRKEHGSSSQVAESVFHIGLVHDVIRQEYDKALPYHQEAYKLATETDDKLIMSYAIRHIGFTKLAVEDLAGAKQDFTESLELRESIGFKPGIAFSLATLARVELMENNNKQALAYLKKARKLLSSLGATPCVEWIDSLIAEITKESQT